MKNGNERRLGRNPLLQAKAAKEVREGNHPQGCGEANAPRAGKVAQRRLALSPAEAREHFEEEARHGARLKVVGVGGGGSNAVNRMIREGVEGIEFAVVNTDAQALRESSARHKAQIGAKLTKGFGSGSDPEIGRRAALEDTDKLIEILEGADMVFITAGLGGGTGGGAAPIVA